MTMMIAIKRSITTKNTKKMSGETMEKGRFIHGETMKTTFENKT